MFVFNPRASSLAVVCVVFMFGRLQALVPSEATPRSEGQHGEIFYHIVNQLNHCAQCI